jgi:predicted nucleic-acid-binding protein
MIAVDTNVLLRFLLRPVDKGNPDWQVEAAQEVIRKADEVFVSDIVVAEIEWVLEAVFQCNRKEIFALLHDLANNTKFRFEDWTVFNRALIDYTEYKNVELSDCLIARRAEREGADTLYTFETNKKLGALPVVTTLTKAM